MKRVSDSVSLAQALIIGICLTLPAAAQGNKEPPEREQTDIADQDTNPTRPVFWSLRQEYYNFTGNVWGLATVVRKDKAVLEKRGLGSDRGIILRLDAPVVQASVGEESEVGLGDFYLQALYIPRLGRRFAFATGTGLVIPTATDEAVGRGKWQLAPLAIPVWFLSPRGFFLVRLQDTFSFAGAGSRPDVHFFQAQPALLWRLSRRLWAVADTEAKINWENGHAASFKSGLQLGWMFSRRFGLAFKPEVNWGGNQEGDWALKTLMIWVRLD